jgi:hypothetical protein
MGTLASKPLTPRGISQTSAPIFLAVTKSSIDTLIRIYGFHTPHYYFALTLFFKRNGYKNFV